MVKRTLNSVIGLFILGTIVVSACLPVLNTQSAPSSEPTQTFDQPPVSNVDPPAIADADFPAELAADTSLESPNSQEGLPDPVSGLPRPQLLPAPSSNGRSASAISQQGTAMLVIGGELPLVLTGGVCQPFEGDTYLNIPNIAGAQPPYASLVINGGEGLTRSGYLTWATTSATTDSATVSTQDIFVITLNDDGFSGSFQGTAHRVTNNVPILQRIQVTGVFTCVASLLTVRGQHPLDLDGAQCELEPQFVMRAGQRGQNQVLLMLEPESEPGDNDIPAGISWNVGGVTYTSSWLSANRNADGLSGSYFGSATGPDGVPFDVEGTFNCLGG